MNRRVRPLPFRRSPLEVGISEAFAPDEYDRVERVVADLHTLGVKRLRTLVSWAEWWEEPGREWYGWLIPRLAREFDLLPCFVCTPPSYGEAAATSAPPRETNVFADFLSVVLDRVGEHLQTVELWNEPNNPAEWDPIRDPGWEKFARTVTLAAQVARARGMKTVLGGMRPIDPNWLCVMFDQGVMEQIDIVGVHAFPGQTEPRWDGWGEEIGRLRRVLDERGSRARIWVTESGHSTVDHGEFAQLRAMSDLLDAPVDRAYWSSLYDLDRDGRSGGRLPDDGRSRLGGMKTASGSPKLLFRLWREYGLEGVREAASWPQVYLTRSAADGRVLVTGGAGFLGAHVAEDLARQGRKVRILDNLSRPGVERNLQWLQQRFPDKIEFDGGDVRDRVAVGRAVRGVDRIYHLAAQPAAAASLDEPLLDFEINLQGTMNVLEAARRVEPSPSFVYASSTRVYGGLAEHEVRGNGRRYEPIDDELRRRGIPETRRLDVRTPFACSKSAAARYVLDYARTLGLRSTVLRVGAVYGSREPAGTGQGWIGRAIVATLADRPWTLGGDGRQVADVLAVEDFVAAIRAVEGAFDRLVGEVWNVAGGPERSLSPIELVDLLEDLHGKRPRVSFGAGGAPVPLWLAADIGRFAEATGWAPRVGVEAGVSATFHWWEGQRGLRLTSAGGALG